MRWASKSRPTHPTPMLKSNPKTHYLHCPAQNAKLLAKLCQAQPKKHRSVLRQRQRVQKLLTFTCTSLSLSPEPDRQPEQITKPLIGETIFFFSFVFFLFLLISLLLFFHSLCIRFAQNLLHFCFVI